jgi:hypothetical protein
MRETGHNIENKANPALLYRNVDFFYLYLINPPLSTIKTYIRSLIPATSANVIVNAENPTDPVTPVLPFQGRPDIQLKPCNTFFYFNL